MTSNRNSGNTTIFTTEQSNNDTTPIMTMTNTATTTTTSLYHNSANMMMFSFYDNGSYEESDSSEGTEAAVNNNNAVEDDRSSLRTAVEEVLIPSSSLMPPTLSMVDIENTKQCIERLETTLHSFVDESIHGVHWTRSARASTFAMARDFLDTLSVSNHNVFTDLEQCLFSEIANYIFEPQLQRSTRRGVLLGGGIAVFSKFRRIYLRNRITHYLGKLNMYNDPKLYDVLLRFCDIVITMNASSSS